MASFVEETFTEQRIVLDGNSYSNCKFIKCFLSYEGGTIPILKNNLFDGCIWDLEGPAGRTLGFLRMLFLSGGDQLVKQMLEKLVTAPSPSKPTETNTSDE